jgi:cell division septum initiation protein DivIVA
MDDVPTILDTVIRAIARVQKKRYTTAKDIEELAATLKEAGRRLDDIAWRKARARAERS